MKFRVTGLALAFLCGAVLLSFAVPAHAQTPMRLQISDGRVTLHAQNVPVRTILAEWARLGGAKIINGDRVAGAPLTLDLEGVPERQALNIVLRGVAGYVLAAREPGGAGASMYDRIMILPTSVAPRNPAPAAAGPVFQGGPAGMIRPIAPRLPDDQDASADDNIIPDNPININDGVPLGRPVPVARPVGGLPPGGFNGPVMPPIVAPDAEPAQPQQPAGAAPTPSNPFGFPAGSSMRPGTVAPAPPPPTATRPSTTEPN